MKVRNCVVFLVILLSVTAARSQTVADYFNAGQRCTESKNWDCAIQNYTYAINLDPNLETAIHNRGRAYTEKRQYKLAVADLDRAVRLAPNEAGAYLDRSYALFNWVDWDPWEEEFDDAYDDVLKAIRLEPNNKYAHYNKAYADWNDESYQKAKDSINTVLRLDPSFPGASDLLAKINKSIAAEDAAKKSGAAASEATKLNTQAEAAFNAKNYKEAIKLYSQALVKQPNNLTSLFWRGRAYLADYENDKAIADYDAYIKLSASEPAAYFNRALAKYNKGSYDDAIGDHTKTITLSPTWVSDVYVRRGLAFKAKNDMITALADMDQAVKLKADSIYALSNRAFVYKATKQFDLAIADATRVISLAPKDPGAYLDRGRIFKDKKDLVSALADYDQALKIDPKSTTPLYDRIAVFKEQKDFASAEAEYLKIIAISALSGYHDRGHYYWNQGKLDLAVADFTECIKLKPDGWGYYWDRAEVLRLNRKFTEAQADYDQMVKLSSLAPSYSYRGNFFLAAGELALAEADIKKATEMKPDEALSLAGLGNLASAKGDFVSAAAHYDAALAKSPNFNIAYLGRAQMFAKQKKTAEAIAELKKVLELNADYYEAKMELERLSKPPAKAPPAKRPVKKRG